MSLAHTKVTSAKLWVAGQDEVQVVILQQMLTHGQERLPARKQVPHSRTIQAVVVQVIGVGRVAQRTGGVVRLVFQARNLPQRSVAEPQPR